MLSIFNTSSLFYLEFDVTIMILSIILAGLITMFINIVYTAHSKRRKLHWIAEVPGVPVLGNALEVQNSTKTMKVFSNYLDRHNGLCRVNFIYDVSILTSDPKFLEFVLSSNKILNKGREYDFLHPWLGEGLLTAPGEKWRKNRKIITPAFHFSILEEFVHTFEDDGSVLVEILQQHVDKIFNILPFVTMCTLDSICKAAMGVSINAQKDVHSEYAYCVKEMCRILIARSFTLKRYDVLYPLSRDFYKEKKYTKVLHSMTKSVIKSRKEQLKNTKRDDQEHHNEDGTPRRLAFLDLLIKAQMEGKDLSDTAIREEVDTFMFEGHDTTTSAICFVLYCLSNHPEYQDLIINEQKLLFGNDRNRAATFRDLQEMKFLEKVIKESLRLYPSVPYISRNTTNDIEYTDGHIIPKGVNLILAGYKAMRNPAVFENPDTFNPNRFDTTESKQWNFSYLPFSAGPRNCVGQKFAMLEVKSMVSKILRNFVVHSGGPENEVILVAEAVLTSLNGFNLKLTRRDW